MALDTEANRNVLISWFPGLGTDANFKITSPCTWNYNCIAWAMGFDDRWVAHAPGAWWPAGVRRGALPGDLKAAFEAVGFVETDDYLYEEGFDKAVLYMNETTGDWTHASRIVATGLEHSKFGNSWDGSHSHAVFGGTIYGVPYVCMVRSHVGIDEMKRRFPLVKPKITVSPDNLLARLGK